MSSSVTLAPASPSCWERIFCCCRTKPAKQKDDDDDEIDFGQTGETLSELSQAFEILNKKRTLKLRKIERIKKEQIDPLALQVQKITADLLKVQTKIQEKMGSALSTQSQQFNHSTLRHRTVGSPLGQSHQLLQSLHASQPTVDPLILSIKQQFFKAKFPTGDGNLTALRWAPKGDFANSSLAQVILTNYGFLNGVSSQDELKTKLNSLPKEITDEVDVNAVANKIITAIQAHAQQSAASSSTSSSQSSAQPQPTV